MRKALKDKAGGIPIIFIGLIFALLLTAFLIMEMGAAYENYYDAETILQRCCNSAVKKNLVDEYRADHILYLNVSGAKNDFYGFLKYDMPEKITVAVSSVTGTATPPNLKCTIAVHNQTIDITVSAAQFQGQVKEIDSRKIWKREGGRPIIFHLTR